MARRRSEQKEVVRMRMMLLFWFVCYVSCVIGLMVCILKTVGLPYREAKAKVYLRRGRYWIIAAALFLTVSVLDCIVWSSYDGAQEEQSRVQQETEVILRVCGDWR